MNYAQLQKGWALFECPLAGTQTEDLVYFQDHPTQNHQIYSRRMLEKLPKIPHSNLEHERICPLTRARVSLLTLTSALPYRNIFCILVRNTFLHNPKELIRLDSSNQFYFDETTNEILFCLSNLSQKEIFIAENALEKMLGFQKSASFCSSSSSSFSKDRSAISNFFEIWQFNELLNPNGLGLNSDLATPSAWKNISDLSLLLEEITNKTALRPKEKDFQKNIENLQKKAATSALLFSPPASPPLRERHPFIHPCLLQP